MSLFFLVSVLAAVVNQFNHPLKFLSLPTVAVSLLGSALGIFLGFRTNSAYDRWWEARKLWGRVVNSSRSLARQAISFSAVVPPAAKQDAAAFAGQITYLQLAFVHALRCALRRQEPWADIAPFLDETALAALKRVRNVPCALLQMIGVRAAEATERGLINQFSFQRIDATLSELSDVQGGCERIKNTPLPRQYHYYPELFIKAYCCLLPLVLVEQLQFLTPVITLLISFAFLVLNQIGTNLEDPFENTVYDTPMTAISRTIEIDLRQSLGEQTTLEPAAPVKGVLW